jgi:hypothetical protein
MATSDQILLYLSAATDLEAECEIVGRTVTELPVSLGWRIVRSPNRDEPVDQETVARADLHLLLLGSDVRAPIGSEWLIARRSGRRPNLFLKQNILRTPAAQNFLRYLREQGTWHPFHSGAELRIQVLRLLVGNLLNRAVSYGLSLAEVARLQTWQAELDAHPPEGQDIARGGAGGGGVVLSPERYTPSEGVLIQPRRETDRT